MKYWFMGLATIFYLTPIAYTFLALVGKIGPTDSDRAFILGVFLWFIGLFMGCTITDEAIKLSKK